MQVTLAIPKALTSLPQWVVWRLEETADGKPTKIPYTAARPYAKASTTNPATWDSYERAQRTADNPAHKVSGVGFVFAAGDGLCGLDLDHCLDDNGFISEFAQAMLDRFDSYAEFSPSGKGIHILIQATPPRGRKTPNIEVYDRGRYFTCTGDKVPGTPRTINARQDELDELFESALLAEDEDATNAGDLNWDAPLTTDDHEVIRLVGTSSQGGKFRRLYDHGDTLGYGSGSEADLALCAILAFWTDNNPSQIDRMFRASQLMRAKWDEKRGKDTYGELTIAKAISGTTETYKGKGKRVREDGTGPRFGTGPSAGADSGPEPEVDPETGEIKSLFVWATDLDSIPEQEWLIESMAPKDALCAIVGDFGSKKTFLLLDMACCISTGKPWHGRDVQQGTVVYIYAEGLKGLRKRMRAWEEENKRTVSNIAFVPRAIRMMNPEDLALLIESIKSEITPPPAAIFIDTLARSMAGGDENNQKDMGLLIDAADRLRQATNASIWFAHHVNRSGSYRGSSVLPGALDVMVESVAKGQIVTLHCEKLKDEEAFDDMKFMVKHVGSSIVLATTTDFQAAQEVLKTLPTDSQEAFEDLAAFGPTGATWGDWKTRTEMDKTPFNHAITALKAARLVFKNDDTGVWVAKGLGGAQ